jgi:hypothetical protein
MDINYDEFKEQQILANKIFTTFTKKEDLDFTLEKIKSNYTILYDKIFVFSSPQTEELICTYNIDQVNCTNTHIIENTVLLHRKKATKTLFSINAINILNENGYKDENGQYDINWEDYQESILLTRKGVFTQLKIDLYTIIYL